MSIRVTIQDDPPKGFLDLMKKTIFGTGRGMRYQQLNVAERMRSLARPVYISLSRLDKLLAVVNLSKRYFYMDERKYQSYYIRYLSFLAEYQTKKNARKKTNIRSGGILREEINKAFSQPPLIEKNQTAIFYAYVESGNERSRQFCEQFSFVPIRTFSTFIFSRLNPSKKATVRRIRAEEIENVKSLLADTYDSYSFYSQERIDFDRYFVLERDNIIVAGIQIIEANWRIDSMPGFSGKIFLKTLPYLPFLSKIIDPSNYCFLGADQIFIKNNDTKSLQELMEGICYELGYNSMIIWADQQSELNERLNSINLGFLNSLKGKIPSSIIVRSDEENGQLEERLKKTPAYIDPFDLT